MPLRRPAQLSSGQAAAAAAASLVLRRTCSSSRGRQGVSAGKGSNSSTLTTLRLWQTSLPARLPTSLAPHQQVTSARVLS